VNGAQLAGNRGTVVLAVATYAVVLSAARITGAETAGLNAGVEGLSSGAGSILGFVVEDLPLGYAFAAGMVAAVNPCGFALLPAYLTLALGRGDAAGTSSPGVRRLALAARIGLAMTAGFTVLFAVAGLLLGVAATALVHLFPWVGLAVGVVLVALGARLVSGPIAYFSLGRQIADRLGRRAGGTGASGFFLYGLAYGAASLSCTLPIFLAIVGSAFTSADYLAATSQFVLYALGMTSVVIGVTLGIAVLRDGVLRRTRLVMRYVEPASAVFLLLAGAYIIYYWLTLGGLLAAVNLA